MDFSSDPNNHRICCARELFVDETPHELLIGCHVGFFLGLDARCKKSKVERMINYLQAMQKKMKGFQICQSTANLAGLATIETVKAHDSILLGRVRHYAVNNSRAIA